MHAGRNEIQHSLSLFSDKVSCPPRDSRRKLQTSGNFQQEARSESVSRIGDRQEGPKVAERARKTRLNVCERHVEPRFHRSTVPLSLSLSSGNATYTRVTSAFENTYVVEWHRARLLDTYTTHHQPRLSFFLRWSRDTAGANRRHIVARVVHV